MLILKIKFVASDSTNAYQWQYHYTHAVNAFYGLREAIVMVVEEGLEKIVQRHAQVKIVLEQALQEELGLKLFVANPAHRLPGIVCILVPEDIDGMKVIADLDLQHDIAISPSHIQSPKILRIGYLGVNASLVSVRRLVDALKEVLAEQRKSSKANV